MEFNQLQALIKEVSKSNLTKFQFSDEKISISMEVSKEEVVFIKKEEKAKGIEEFSTKESKELSEENFSANLVVAPLVGTFYNAPSPEAKPFIKVGDRVKKGQVLGIVEAMKLMNDITSDYEGVVEKIFVQNEDVVEYGQPLFAIK